MVHSNHNNRNNKDKSMVWNMHHKVNQLFHKTKQLPANMMLLIGIKSNNNTLRIILTKGFKEMLINLLILHRILHKRDHKHMLLNCLKNNLEKIAALSLRILMVQKVKTTLITMMIIIITMIIKLTITMQEIIMTTTVGIIIVLLIFRIIRIAIKMITIIIITMVAARNMTITTGVAVMHNHIKTMITTLGIKKIQLMKTLIAIIEIIIIIIVILTLYLRINPNKIDSKKFNLHISPLLSLLNHKVKCKLIKLLIPQQIPNQMEYLTQYLWE